MEKAIFTTNTIQQYKIALSDPNSSPNTIYQIINKIQHAICKKLHAEISIILQNNLHKIILVNFGHLLQSFNRNSQIPPLYEKIIEKCLTIFAELCQQGSGNKTAQFVDLGIIQATQLAIQLVKYPYIIFSTLKLIQVLNVQNPIINIKYFNSKALQYFFKNFIGYFWKESYIFGQTVCCILLDLFSHTNKMIMPYEHIQSAVKFYLPIVENIMNFPNKSDEIDELLYYVLYHITQVGHQFYQKILEMCQRNLETQSQNSEQVIKIYQLLANHYEIVVKKMIDSHWIIQHLISQLKNKKEDSIQFQICLSALSTIITKSSNQFDYLLSKHPTFFINIKQILLIKRSSKKIRNFVFAICNLMKTCSIQAFYLINSLNIFIPISKKIRNAIKQNQLDQEMAKVYLESIYLHAQIYSQNSDKFVLQQMQKKAFLYTLNLIPPYLKGQQQMQVLKNTINFLQTAQFVQQMSQLQIAE